MIDLTVSCTGLRQIKDFKREGHRAGQRTLAITKQNTDRWRGGGGGGGKEEYNFLALLKSAPARLE